MACDLLAYLIGFRSLWTTCEACTGHIISLLVVATYGQISF